MSIEKENENWMGVPQSNVKDGIRWGRATKDGAFHNGYREQKIGNKIIKHRPQKNEEIK